MTTARVIIDTSVWSRVRTSVPVAKAMERLIASVDPLSILMCPPIAAELGFSARNGSDHSTLAESLRAFPDCAEAPSSSDVLQIQNVLWWAGLVRAVGATDALIAAYATKNDATVIHLDRDFEHVARAIPAFKHRWLVPSREL